MLAPYRLRGYAAAPRERGTFGRGRRRLERLTCQARRRFAPSVPRRRRPLTARRHLLVLCASYARPRLTATSWAVRPKRGGHLLLRPVERVLDIGAPSRAQRA